MKISRFFTFIDVKSVDLKIVNLKIFTIIKMIILSKIILIFFRDLLTKRLIDNSLIVIIFKFKKTFFYFSFFEKIIL